MIDLKINVPEDVQDVISQLEDAGYTAYIVGGCVRDAVMGKQPHDYDICTSATPEEMMRVFSDRDVIETGLKHGTITVKGMDDFYEVTTYRIDGEYLDGRHPESVQFVDNIEADLARRDFTINAMAYNSKTGFIDPFGGIEDIQKKIIRCVGNPDKRFNEDALRIMRAVRFSAVCDFKIEDETKQSMFRNKNLLEQVSAERKTSEFCKMLRVAKFDLLNDYKDIFATFIPELKDSFYFNQNNWHHKYDVYEHMMHSVDLAPNDLLIRLSLFFHDIGKPSVYTEDEKGIGHFYGHPSVSEEMTEKIMRRMKFDTNSIKKVTELVSAHDIEPSDSLKFTRKMLNRFGEEQLRRLIVIEECDKGAQTENKDSIQSLRNLKIVRENIDKVLQEKECFSIKDLALNGNDLKEIGIQPGIFMGKILNHLLEKVMENPKDNNKETLNKFVDEFIKENDIER